MKAILIFVACLLCFLIGFTTHHLYTEKRTKNLLAQIDMLNNSVEMAKKQNTVEKIIIDHNAVQCVQ
jgi:uncharacterized membrane protein